MEERSREAVRRITSEITSILQDLPCTIVSSSSSMIGTLLHVQVSCIDDDLLDRIQAVAIHREVVRAMWRDPDSLYLHIGFDSWAYTRTDRYEGSRVLGAQHDLPLSSVQTVQLVKLSLTSASLYIFIKAYQQMAWFLKASLRLNTFEITRVIETLQSDANMWNWPMSGKCLGLVLQRHLITRSDPPLTCSVADRPPSSSSTVSSVQQAALECLQHPLEHSYGSSLQDSLGDTTLLGRLNKCHDISHAERELRGSFLVVMARAKSCKDFLRITRRCAPSLFVDFSPEIACKAQVHILEAAVMRCKSSLLLSFSTEPTHTNIQAAISSITAVLGLNFSQDDWVSTLPYRHTQTVTPVFLPTGRANHVFFDQVICPRLRATLSTSLADPEYPTLVSTSAAMEDDAPPHCAILWIRQSTMEQADCLAKQLWCILNDASNPILPLRPRDSLQIIVEVSSSSRRPLRDRILFDKIIESVSTPFTMLTTSPDRLTRRSSEVEMMISHIQQRGGRWMSMGCISEDFSTKEWCNVADVKTLVEQQVSDGNTVHLSVHDNEAD